MSSTKKKSSNTQNMMVIEPVHCVEQESDCDDEQILSEQFMLKGYEEPVTN